MRSCALLLPPLLLLCVQSGRAASLTGGPQAALPLTGGPQAALPLTGGPQTALPLAGADPGRDGAGRLLLAEASRRQSGLQQLARVLTELRRSLQTRLDLSIELMEQVLESQDNRAEDVSFINANFPTETAEEY